MSRGNTTLTRAAYDALYVSGVSWLLRPASGGIGAIISLNRHVPPWSDPLRPPSSHVTSPRFIEDVILWLRRRRIEIVPADEMHRRLTERDFRRRFCCLTLDGAWRDHHDRAWPVFRKHNAPVTLFVPTGFPDRVAEIWWLAVAAVVARNTSVMLLLDGREQRVDCVTEADKRYLYNGLMAWLLARADYDEIVLFVRDLCVRYGVDLTELRETMCMTWDQIAHMANDPLVTIGAQSISHPILTKLSPERAGREIAMSRSVIEGALGIAPKHFAYPFGQPDTYAAREVEIVARTGYLTAMTLEPGVLTRAHATELTALPRLSFGPGMQRLRYVKVAMSGASAMIGARVRDATLRFSRRASTSS